MYSLGKNFLYSIERRQNLSSTMADCNRVLIMSCRLSVDRPNSPTVGREIDTSVAKRNHRFNGNAHTCFQQDTVATATIVGHRRIFVHFSANAMTSDLSNHTVTLSFAMVLYC